MKGEEIMNRHTYHFPLSSVGNKLRNIFELLITKQHTKMDCYNMCTSHINIYDLRKYMNASEIRARTNKRSKKKTNISKKQKDESIMNESTLYFWFLHIFFCLYVEHIVHDRLRETSETSWVRHSLQSNLCVAKTPHLLVHMHTHC